MNHFCAVLVLCAASTVYGAVDDCGTVNDGTPCTGACVAAGTCFRGRCRPGQLRADGTACSSGHRCSTGDTCSEGECRPGTGQVVCPSHDRCLVGACDESVGCVLINECSLEPLPPGEPPLPRAPAPATPGAPTDPTPPTTDGGVAPDDGGQPATPVTESPAVTQGQVRGNNLAGLSCSFAPGTSTSPLLPLLLMVVASLLLWLRRRGF
jgi:hypothetical protein